MQQIKISNGTITFMKDGKLHRDNDEPAVITKDGNRQWFCNGKLHRIGGPAVVYPNGDYIYFKNGLRHREDGPATLNKNNGVVSYFQNGSLHREDGPAIITERWDYYYRNNNLHRIDGPATVDKNIEKDCTQTWHINGRRMCCPPPPPPTIKVYSFKSKVSHVNTIPDEPELVQIPKQMTESFVIIEPEHKDVEMTKREKLFKLIDLIMSNVDYCLIERTSDDKFTVTI